MKLTRILLFFSFAVLLSCDKESKEKETPPPDNYQPVTDFSIWTYSEYPSTALYSIRITGWDTTFNKKKYTEMFSTLTGYSYFRKEGGNYYLMFPDDTLTEFLYLKDRGLTGDNWEQKVQVSGFDATFKYKITARDIESLVNGIIYKQVITVRRDTWVDFGTGSDSLVSSELSSYANNVGLILIDQGIEKVYLSHYQIFPE